MLVALVALTFAVSAQAATRYVESADSSGGTLSAKGDDSGATIVGSGENVFVWVGKGTGINEGNADNDFTTGANWLSETAPGANALLDFTLVTNAVTVNANIENTTFATATMGTGVVTLNGSLHLAVLTNGWTLAVASGATLAIDGDLVTAVDKWNDARTLLYSNEGTVTVGGNARGYAWENSDVVMEYAVVTENTQPIRAGGIAYGGGPGQLYMKLQSSGNKAGSWVVGAGGMTFLPGARNAAYSTFWAQGAPITLYSSADWTLANSTRYNTVYGDLYVPSNSGSSLAIDTSDYDDPATPHTVTLKGRIVAFQPVTIKGCGTVVVDTTGSYENLPEYAKHTCLTNGTTLAVTDTATLQVNDGKKITGNGTVSLASGATLSVANDVGGMVTLPSVSAAAGSTVVVSNIVEGLAGEPAIALTGNLAGPAEGTATLRKGDGPFEAGYYVIATNEAFSASAATEAANIVPELAEGMNYTYFVRDNKLCLFVNSGADLSGDVWVGKGTGLFEDNADNNFTTGANWLSGTTPSADAALNFTLVTNAVTVNADAAGVAYGALATGSGVVTFTNSLAVASISGTAKVAVDKGSTVTLEGDLVFATNVASYVCHSIAEGGRFVVTGDIVASDAQTGNVYPCYVAANAGVISAKGLVNNVVGSDRFYLARTADSTANWLIGEDGISGTRRFTLFKGSGIDVTITAAADFAISANIVQWQSLTINPAGHTVTIGGGDSNTSTGGGILAPGTTTIAGSGTVVANYDVATLTATVANRAPKFVVGGTATLRLAEGADISTGDLTMAKGTTLELPASANFAYAGVFGVTEGDGETVKIQLGSAANDVFAGRIKVLTAEKGFGEGVTAECFSLANKSVGGVEFEIVGNDLWVTTGGDYLWTGLGDGVNFSDDANWLGNVAPTNGGENVVFFTESAATLNCDIREFAPNSITFAAGTAAVDVKQANGAVVTNVNSIVNYADDVHHNFAVPVYFADGVQAEVTLSGSRYIKFYGGMTAWDVKNVGEEAQYYGIFEYTRERINWSYKDQIRLPKGSKTTLTIHEGIVSYTRNFNIRPGTVLRNIGDYTFSNTYVRTSAATKIYGQFEVTGYLVGENGATMRPSTGWSNGRLRAYGLVNNSTNAVGELSYQDGVVYWGIGEGGLSGDCGFRVPAVRKATLNTVSSFPINAKIENLSTLELGTTGELSKQPCTITVSNNIFGVGSVVVDGKGAVHFTTNSTFTGGLTVNYAATLAVDAGVQAGAGDVTMEKGTTLVVPLAADANDAAVAFAGKFAVTGTKGKVKIRFADGAKPADGVRTKVFAADSFDFGGEAAADVFDFGMLATCEVADGALWIVAGGDGYFWGDGDSGASWLGSGVWKLNGTAATWDPDHVTNAVFATAGDKATVDADVSAAEVIFTESATVEGAKTLTTPKMDVFADVEATVNANVGGALEKVGPGKLTLGANRSAQTTVSEGTLAMSGATVDPAKLTLGSDATKAVTFDYGAQELASAQPTYLKAGADVTLENGTYKFTSPVYMTNENMFATLTVGQGATLTAPAFKFNTTNEATLNVCGGSLVSTTAAAVSEFMNTAATGTFNVNMTEGGLVDVNGDLKMLCCSGAAQNPAVNWNIADSTLRVRGPYWLYLGTNNNDPVNPRVTFTAANSTIDAGTGNIFLGNNKFNGTNHDGWYKADFSGCVVTAAQFCVYHDRPLSSVRFDDTRIVYTASKNFWLEAKNAVDNTAVTVGENGLVLDSNGFDGQIRADVGGYGAITKTGEGKMTLMVSQTATEPLVDEGEVVSYSEYICEQGELALGEGISVARPVTIHDGAAFTVAGTTASRVDSLSLASGAAFNVAGVADGVVPLAVGSLSVANAALNVALAAAPASGARIVLVRSESALPAGAAAKFALNVTVAGAAAEGYELAQDGKDIVLVAPVTGFQAGDKYGENDCGELTEAQADWLNSLDNYDELKTKLETVSPDDLDKACLLNLDILLDGIDGGVAITNIVSAVVGDAEVITLDVVLSRVGTLAPATEGGRTPINGVLKLCGTTSLEALDSFVDLGDKSTVEDAKFATGDMVKCHFTRTDDAKMFFRAKIVEPAD